MSGPRPKLRRVNPEPEMRRNIECPECGRPARWLSTLQMYRCPEGHTWKEES